MELAQHDSDVVGHSASDLLLVRQLLLDDLEFATVTILYHVLQVRHHGFGELLLLALGEGLGFYLDLDGTVGLVGALGTLLAFVSDILVVGVLGMFAVD